MQICKILPVCCLALFATGGICNAASLTGIDRNFMVNAARSDMTQAHESELAENRGARADVRDFAKTVVQERAEAYGRLSLVAAQTGTAIPKGIDAGKVPAIRELVHLKGDRFDRQFVGEQIAAVRQAIALSKREAAHGRDADVKAIARQTIPVLEKDLRLAQECAKSAGRS